MILFIANVPSVKCISFSTRNISFWRLVKIKLQENSASPPLNCIHVSQTKLLSWPAHTATYFCLSLWLRESDRKKSWEVMAPISPAIGRTGSVQWNSAKIEGVCWGGLFLLSSFLNSLIHIVLLFPVSKLLLRNRFSKWRRCLRWSLSSIILLPFQLMP